jgi:hypothetical protein
LFFAGLQLHHTGFLLPSAGHCYDVLILWSRSNMHWYDFLSYFFGGAFLANALPHLLNGISGRSFQSPFAKPPGEGLSSPIVNVLWGFFNLVVAYFLVMRVGDFSLHNSVQVTALGAGLLLMSVLLARSFGRFHSRPM